MSRQIARETLSRMSAEVSFVSERHAQHVVEDLQALALVQDDSLQEASAERQMIHLMDAYGYAPTPEAQPKPFAYADGVAIIPVHGTLINRFAYSWGFVTGYNFVRKQKNAALADDDVKLIVYDYNSYGGMAAGCFELADEIRESREIKPSLAVVDSNCCSAAYALASACTSLVVTPSGQAGSIGVIAMHMSLEGALDKAGIEVTIFSKGARKADFNPYKRLTREAAEEMDASIDKSYDKFVALVVKNRGLDDQAIRDTESRVYSADEALELNLIDAVKTPTDAVASFLAEMGDDEPTDDEDTDLMANAAETGTAQTPTPEQAAATARTEERARVKGIQTHAEAVTRPKLAAHLAMDTDMTVEAAATILAAAAVETKAEAAAPAAAATEAAAPAAAAAAPTGTGALAAAMASSDQPNVGADGKPVDADGKETKAGPSRAQLAMGFAGITPKEGSAKH